MDASPAPTSTKPPGSSKKVLFLVFLLTLVLGGAAVFTASRLRQPEPVTEKPTRAALLGRAGNCITPQERVSCTGESGCCVSLHCDGNTCYGWRDDAKCPGGSCGENCQCTTPAPPPTPAPPSASEGKIGSCTGSHDCQDNKGVGSGCCTNAHCDGGTCYGWKQHAYCRALHGNSYDWSCSSNCQCVEEPRDGGEEQGCFGPDKGDVTFRVEGRSVVADIDNSDYVGAQACLCDNHNQTGCMTNCTQGSKTTKGSSASTSFADPFPCGTLQVDFWKAGGTHETYCIWNGPTSCEEEPTPPPTGEPVACVGVSPRSFEVAPGGSMGLTASGTGGTEPRTFTWTATGGTVTSSHDRKKVVTWKAPASAKGGDSYTITATVHDADNQTATSNTCKATATISEELTQDPRCLALTAEPTSGQAPVTVSFSVSASDPSSRIVAYKYTFGDGNTEEKATAATTHTYATNGTYTAKVNLRFNSSYTADLAECTKTLTFSPGGGEDEDGQEYSHTVCTSDNRCVSVSGAGTSECEVDADCSAPTTTTTPPPVPETGAGRSSLLLFLSSLGVAILGLVGLKKIDPLFKKFEKRLTE